MTQAEIEESIHLLNDWTDEMASVLNTIVQRIESLSERIENLNARINEFRIQP